MLTVFVNGGRSERLGDDVDAPTIPPVCPFPTCASLTKRADLPLPAFLRSRT
jgi:hypothetical protein